VIVPYSYQGQWCDEQRTSHLTVVVILPSGVGEEDVESMRVEDDGTVLVITMKMPKTASNAKILFSNYIKSEKLDARKQREIAAITDALGEMKTDDKKTLGAVARIPLDIEVQDLIMNVDGVLGGDSAKCLIITLSAPEAAFGAVKIGGFEFVEE
jgi:hypothetical protein